MGQISFELGERSYNVGCRDGEEPHLRMLAERLSAMSDTAMRASGGQSQERMLVYIALMLADQMSDMERDPVEGIPPALLDRLAERLEAVASALEEEPPTP